MILVVGATGMVGGEICRRLVAQGKPVRAMVRAESDSAKRATLEGMGAEIVQGDLRDRASLDAACRGVEAVISTASSMPSAYRPGENSVENVDQDGLIQLVDAARAAGVGRFIYTSFTPKSEAFPLANAKRAVERRLQESGLAYTILRPSYFSELWLSPAVGFDYPNAKAQIYGTGDKPVSYISFQDVVAFAVAALDNPKARDAVLELGGPRAVSQLEAVRIFEEIGGRKFEVQSVPEEALQTQMNSATDPFQSSFAGLTIDVARGDPVDMRATLEAFPISLTSVEDYARRVLVSA